MNIWEYLNAREIRNADLDILISQTQRSISKRTLLLIGGVLAVLLLMPLLTEKKIDPVVEKLLYVVLGGLITNWAGQNQFWYGRPRAGGVPDPGTVTTTREDPDGGKTTTVMPAMAAAPAVQIPVSGSVQSPAAPVVLPSGPTPPAPPAGG